jgi:hypothetical protein
MHSGKPGRGTLLGRDEVAAVFPESGGWLEGTLDMVINTFGAFADGFTN